MPDAGRLRERIRQKLGSGALFYVGRKMWAGRSTGRDCIVCSEVISLHKVEYEVPGPHSNVYAHVRCWMIWREESAL